MEFFDQKERFALEQVAERINKLQGADWNSLRPSTLTLHLVCNLS